MTPDSRIKEIMAHVFKCSPDEIDQGASFWTVEGWDSLTHVSLLVALEKEFGLRFDAREAADLLDFQSVREVLARRAAGAAGAAAPPRGFESLAGQFGALPLTEGCVLMVHSSYAALGATPGGPLSVVEALLAVLRPLDGTLVMPTMSGRNQLEYHAERTETYDMGLLPETFRRMEGVRRSSHPTSSLSAFGPRSEYLLNPHPLDRPEGPDGPLGRMHELDARVLLLGVDHTANTAIHLAEYLENVPYQTRQPVSRLADSSLRDEMWCISHCAGNFNKLDAVLREAGVVQTHRIGMAEAQFMTMRDVVSFTRKLLKDDPLIFLCRSGRCESCEGALAAAHR